MESELLVKQELKAMRRNAFLVLRTLARVLREEGHNPKWVLVRLQGGRKLRLGILQVWATRYEVALTYVIKTLLSYWRQKSRRPGKKTPLLGVSVAALTSVRSEPILAGAIEREYPGGENRIEFQTQHRMRLLGLDEPVAKARSLVDVVSLDESCKQYGRRIKRRQKRLDKAAEGQWRRRRRWRGNPWL